MALPVTRSIDLTNIQFPSSDLRQAGSIEVLFSLLTGSLWHSTEAISIFKDDPLLSDPGTSYLYTTHGWTLLSAVIEGASGEDFLLFMKKLFKELGMENTCAELNNRIIYNRARLSNLLSIVIRNWWNLVLVILFCTCQFVQTVDCNLQTGWKILTEGKLKTACQPGRITDCRFCASQMYW